MAWKTQLRLPEAHQYKRKADDYGKGSPMVGAEKGEALRQGRAVPTLWEQREERRFQCLPVGGGAVLSLDNMGSRNLIF